MTAEPVSPHAPALQGRVMMSQDWCDVTFLHWAIDADRVAHLMPPGARPDVWEGGATYVGLVLFRMVHAGPARLGGVPWLGSFLETNVRLYSIDHTGRRGVVFLSLDADRLAIVIGARAAFNLPYRWADMSYRRSMGGHEHEYAARLRRPGSPVSSRVGVRVGQHREPSELDLFLTARWGLHSRHLGRNLYTPNAHEPWPLFDATLIEFDDGLVASVGLPDVATRAPDQVCFSPGVHAEFSFPANLAEGRTARR